MKQTEADRITGVLETAKTIAVVGLTNTPMRPSYGVSHYMQSQGYRIIPVNPNITEWQGEKAYDRKGEQQFSLRKRSQMQSRKVVIGVFLLVLCVSVGIDRKSVV